MTELPNEYTFEQIQPGQTISFREKITRSHLDIFANLSGDYNPLHMDANYAENTKFKKQVCHGMLLASFFSKLDRKSTRLNPVTSLSRMPSSA